MNLKQVIRGELIGKIITITHSNNKTLVNVKGRVIDETQHTLILEDKENKRKRILKNSITFKITHKGEKVIIKGKQIIGRPEERVKLKVK
tara:strand:- start:305 stop:574 length:270 start_codon:yes stop_codon:yes gene_type:complete